MVFSQKQLHSDNGDCDSGLILPGSMARVGHCAAQILPLSPPAHRNVISTTIHPSQSCSIRAVESISLCVTLMGHTLGQEMLLRNVCLTQSARNEFS